MRCVGYMAANRNICIFAACDIHPLAAMPALIKNGKIHFSITLRIYSTESLLHHRHHRHHHNHREQHLLGKIIYEYLLLTAICVRVCLIVLCDCVFFLVYGAVAIPNT